MLAGSTGTTAYVEKLKANGLFDPQITKVLLASAERPEPYAALLQKKLWLNATTIFTTTDHDVRYLPLLNLFLPMVGIESTTCSLRVIGTYISVVLPFL